MPDLLEILYVFDVHRASELNTLGACVSNRNSSFLSVRHRSLGAMSNPMFALKGPKMKHGVKGYETNFPLEHAQKDIRFAQLLGDELGISMGVSSAANGTMCDILSVCSLSFNVWLIANERRAFFSASKNGTRLRKAWGSAERTLQL